jgi:hypothetical protein
MVALSADVPKVASGRASLRSGKWCHSPRNWPSTSTHHLPLPFASDPLLRLFAAIVLWRP